MSKGVLENCDDSQTTALCRHRWRRQDRRLSSAAEILADNGIHVVVIEQNKRPYGKIEDGLPRWHVEQRKSQEYSRIDARLKKPGVFFLLPCAPRWGAIWTFRIFATTGVSPW